MIFTGVQRSFSRPCWISSNEKKNEHICTVFSLEFVQWELRGTLISSVFKYSVAPVFEIAFHSYKGKHDFNKRLETHIQFLTMIERIGLDEVLALGQMFLIILE